MKKRIHYLVLTLVILILEVIIAVYVKDKLIRPYVGDILAIIFVYFGIKTLYPSLKQANILAFLIGCIIEISQGFQILKYLGLQDNKWLSIILGSTFDWSDLFCYFIGFIIIFILNSSVVGKSSHKFPSER